MVRYFVLRYTFQDDSEIDEYYESKTFFKRKRNLLRGTYIYPVIVKYRQFEKSNYDDYKHRHTKEYDYYSFRFGNDFGLQITIYTWNASKSKFYARLI